VINHLPVEKNGKKIGRVCFTAAKDAKETKNECGMFLKLSSL